MKGWFAGEACLQIERTHIETIVAAKNMIAELPLQVVRYRGGFPAMFDRQIGEAAVGIHDVGFCDGLRGAGLNTEGAASAEVRRRFVGLQLQGRENFAQ